MKNPNVDLKSRESGRFYKEGNESQRKAELLCTWSQDNQWQREQKQIVSVPCILRQNKFQTIKALAIEEMKA